MTFSDFWANTNNPISTSGLQQILAIFLAVGLAVIIGILFKSKSSSAREKLLKILAFIMLGLEVVIRVVHLATANGLNFSKVLMILLPLDIFSVFVCLFIITAFIRKPILSNFTSICGIVCITMMLIHPVGALNYQNFTFQAIYDIVARAIGLTGAVCLITFGYASFSIQHLPITLLCFELMFLWGAIADFVIFTNQNFMFIRTPPYRLPILSQVPHQVTYGLIWLNVILLFFWLNPLIKKFQR